MNQFHFTIPGTPIESESASNRYVPFLRQDHAVGDQERFIAFEDVFNVGNTFGPVFSNLTNLNNAGLTQDSFGNLIPWTYTWTGVSLTMQGKIKGDPIATGTLCSFEMTFPYLLSFNSENSINGQGVSDPASGFVPVYVAGNPTTHNAVVSFMPGNTSDHFISLTISCIYQP